MLQDVHPWILFQSGSQHTARLSIHQFRTSNSFTRTDHSTPTAFHWGVQPATSVLSPVFLTTREVSRRMRVDQTSSGCSCFFPHTQVGWWLARWRLISCSWRKFSYWTLRFLPSHTTIKCTLTITPSSVLCAKTFVQKSNFKDVLFNNTARPSRTQTSYGKTRVDLKWWFIMYALFVFVFQLL